MLFRSNSAGIDREDIYEVVVAGNTVMTHMLLGIDPAYMIAEPYVPVVRRALSVATGRIGLTCNNNGGLFVFPAVSDFIGGDIIADILACGMSERDEISLLIDIGTNFEVVLDNNEWMFSCAGAAGPHSKVARYSSACGQTPAQLRRSRLNHRHSIRSMRPSMALNPGVSVGQG